MFNYRWLCQNVLRVFHKQLCIMLYIFECHIAQYFLKKIVPPLDWLNKLGASNCSPKSRHAYQLLYCKIYCKEVLRSKKYCISLLTQCSLILQPSTHRSLNQLACMCHLKSCFTYCVLFVGPCIWITWACWQLWVWPCFVASPCTLFTWSVTPSLAVM